MLFSLIDLVVIEPVGTKVASYGLVNFTTSLTQLAKADKMDVPHHLCAPTHDRLQSVLLYLRVRIASEFRSVRQWRLVEIARSIILDHVGPFLSTPAVWRPILDFLLWMMPEFDARVRLGTASASGRSEKTNGGGMALTFWSSCQLILLLFALFSFRVTLKSVS